MPLSDYSHIKYTIRLLVGWLLIFAVGCASPFGGSGRQQNDADIGDAGLLEHQACDPPCFWGITPGITSITETRHILEQKNINDCVPLDADPQYPRLVCGNTVLIRLAAPTGPIAGIGLDPARPITIGAVISSRGQPDAVSVTLQGVEHPHATMMVYFDSLRTRLVLAEQDGTLYRLDSSVEVRNVGFYAGDTYTLDKKYGLSAWRGYGPYPETPIH